MPENSEKVMSTANGSASVVWTSARPSTVSSSPTRMNITASGSASSGSGKGAGHQHQDAECVLSRESRSATAHSLPARPEAMDRIMVSAATRIEFHRARATPAKPMKNCTRAEIEAREEALREAGYLARARTAC